MIDLLLGNCNLAWKLWKSKEQVILINKCPHCGFEPLDGKLVCPRCGHEIQENIAQKLQDIGEKNRKTNDSVAWSDFADVSLGALMSQMTQSDEKSDEKVPPKETNTEETSTEDAPTTKEQDLPKTAVAADDVFAENPILAAYIRQHREGDVGDGPTLEELVAASQENTAETVADPTDSAKANQEQKSTADTAVADNDESSDVENESVEEVSEEVVSALDDEDINEQASAKAENAIEEKLTLEEAAPKLADAPSEDASEETTEVDGDSAETTAIDPAAALTGDDVTEASGLAPSEKDSAPTEFPTIVPNTVVDESDTSEELATNRDQQEIDSQAQLSEEQGSDNQPLEELEQALDEEDVPTTAEMGEVEIDESDTLDDRDVSEAAMTDDSEKFSDGKQEDSLATTVTTAAAVSGINAADDVATSVVDNLSLEAGEDLDPLLDFTETLDLATDSNGEEPATTPPISEPQELGVEESSLDLEGQKGLTEAELDSLTTDESQTATDLTPAGTESLDTDPVPDPTLADSVPEESHKTQEYVLDPVTYADDETEEMAAEPSVETDTAVEDVANQDSNEPRKPRKKWPIFVAAATIALIGGGGYAAYHNQQQAAQAKVQAARKEKAESDAIKQSLAALYQDADQEFLKKGITAADLSAVTNQLEQFKGEKATLEKALTTLNDKFQLQSEVNELFSESVIDGDQLKENVAIKSGPKLAVTVPKDKTAFNQLMTKAVANYNQQFEALATAKDAVAPLLKDGQAIAKPAEADFKEAQKLVSALVDSGDKQALLTQLGLVQKKIAENQAAAKKAQAEAAEAAKKAAAEKAAAEAAAKAEAEAEKAANATQENNSAEGTDNQGSSLPADASANMQPNSDNRPILDSVAADIADSENPAWTWAPGVKADVLATCIERGYIVEGGYTLEPVRIENGEGYYNLYATNNQASLTKGMTDNDLPLYLVTINCKTGYFRGNGNDHTAR